ncbi:hypothetical protein PIB30_049442 [Stylosanthes scabra]|uniref:Uncharacterized protein n=1 Tax=Stylosanthes scabra TaxID=79078 RepID=A0ABU6UH49_9FABA|nr:hypothetical protein [Stylosanthes scabra]
MATPDEPSKSDASLPSLTSTAHLPVFNETTSFVDYVVEHARFYHAALNDAIDSAIDASKSRLSQIRSTSSAHFQQTLHALDDVRAQYNVYEDLMFAKIKEGVLVAASHPMITCGTTSALGVLAFKRPRRFLYYNTLRLFASEEALISRATAQLKELRQSVDLLKAEGEKLEKRALHAEEEFLRGRTKLRHAGKQIRSVIQSTYKIERQVGGLKDILGELPRRDASHLRSQVSKLATETKQEKKSLTKEISKISNYGISV